MTIYSDMFATQTDFLADMLAQPTYLGVLARSLNGTPTPRELCLDRASHTEIAFQVLMVIRSAGWVGMTFGELKDVWGMTYGSGALLSYLIVLATMGALDHDGTTTDFADHTFWVA